VAELWTSRRSSAIAYLKPPPQKATPVAHGRRL